MRPFACWDCGFESRRGRGHLFLMRNVCCEAMEEGRDVHKVLVGKPAGKRPLGRPTRRWEDNIKMDLQELGRCCGDWIGTVGGRL